MKSWKYAPKCEHGAGTCVLSRAEVRVWGGEALSASPGAEVRWVVADQLGTPRMVIDRAGSLSGVTQHDYLPFGEELYAGTGGRVTAQGYGAADSVRQKFAGKERDDETRLDYLGARYMSNMQGRFTSPDPLLSSGQVVNPKTWNRYTYVLNNPLKYIDPSGLYTFDSNATKDQRKDFEDGLKKAINARDSYAQGSEEYNKIDRAIKAYGKAGVDNGVIIAFGPTKGAANTDVGVNADSKASKVTTANNPTGQKIIVTFDTTKNTSSNDYAVNIAHEGSHVADGATLVGALPTDLTNEAARSSAVYGPSNTNMWNSEVKAYEVSAFVGQYVYPRQSLSFGPSNNEVWNPSWAQADRAAKRAAGIEGILTDEKGLYWNNPRLGKGYLED